MGITITAIETEIVTAIAIAIDTATETATAVPATAVPATDRVRVKANRGSGKRSIARLSQLDLPWAC